MVLLITSCLTIVFRTNSVMSYGMDSQSVGPGSGAAASPRNLLERQTLTPCPGLTELEALRLGPSTLVLMHTPGGAYIAVV